MKIDSIFIENMRSHVKTYIKFSKGFNCLVGGLGAGKSSILYAIDFALFGEPLSRSYDYLLREGTDIGRVALKFIENGKEYTIWRGLRRRGERISQDPEQLKLFEGSKLLAEMKSDAVSEQLKSIIGVDREIFRDIIWVRQEKLKEILDIMPAERQRRLDQLFGISDYDISWANLRPVQRWYEGERETLERDPDVIGVKDMQSKYDEAVKELSIREAELEEAHRSLYEAELKLKEASSRLEGLMEMRRKSEEMRNEEADLKSKIGSLESICARLMNEIRERRAKINDLETRLEALNAQEKNVRRRLADLGLSENMSLEDLQSYIDSIIVQISSIRGEEENVRGEIRRATQRISNLVKESRCPLCLQNLLSEYKDKLMKQLNEEISSYRQQLSELERSAKELEHLRSILFAALTSLQSILPKREELTRQLRDEEQQLKRAVEELNAKKEEIEILKSRLTDLKSKIAEFDYSKLEEAQRLYSETLERYSNLKYKVQNLESQKNEIISRLEGLKIRLDIAQKKIERLEKIREILVFIEETRQAYKSIQPKIRGDFVKYLERIVQQIMDELIGSEGELFTIKIDENYTPIIEGEDGRERSASNLSGGERTFLALAYRLGIGQLIMHLKSGRGLSILLLDEPTESLGREDGSIDRLAEMLSRLKTIEQIIAVTHSEAFAEKADQVIRVEKRDGKSVVLTE
ncbi:AAA family ATPase [Candidatus Bathyarchaeota archaeon]|nr:AAA family ATPase [Candidatus Bathyarchaeota archaeon]